MTNHSEVRDKDSNEAATNGQSGGDMVGSSELRSVRWWRQSLVLVLSVIVAARISGAFGGTLPGIDGVWLPAGVIFLGLWRGGLSRWPAVVVGLWIARLWEPLPLLLRAMLVLESTGTWLVGVWLLRRIVGNQSLWSRLIPTSAWIGIAMLACPLINSVLSGVTMWWTVPEIVGHFREVCVVQFLSHAVGVLLVAPVGLAWWPWPKCVMSRWRILEVIGVAVATLAFAYWTFGPKRQLPTLPIPDIALVFPLYVWTLVRFGRRGISLEMFVLGLLSIWSAVYERGPFLRSGGELISASTMLALGNAWVAHCSLLLLTALWIERTLAEQDALKADARFRLLFERSPDATFVVDMSTRELLEFNSRLPELLRCSAESLRQRGVFDFEVDPLDVAELDSIGTGSVSISRISLSMLRPKTEEVDTKFRCATGELVDVRLTYSIVDFFGRRLFLMIARDVTARLRDEQRLRDSEEKFRTLAEHIPAMVAIQRGNSPNYVNHTAVEISGYSSKELLGQSLVNWFRPEYRPQVQEDLSHEAEPRRQVRREVDLTTKSGRLRRVDLNLVPITQAGKPEWLVCAVDVTEQRQAESEIRQLNAELFHAGRLRLLGEMAAGIMHDVKHPLSAISALVEASQKMLHDDRPISATQLSKTLTDIEESVDEALARVQHLQDLSRRKEISRKRISIAPVVADATRLIKLHREWAEVPIAWKVYHGVPHVFADRAALAQVFLDILRNGMEAMSGLPDGERRMAVEISSPGPQHVKISFQDFGCGVPEEFRDRLFKSFETTKADGLGLGLSLCESVIEEHDGKLWFEPGKPQGSIFHILLPTADRS